MIPFGSQRGLGQDLATHLQNEFDNEFMEVAQVRGAIADDLHGAFAEWEIQADALTRCRNYLYSLSINPDPRQGELTRDQYFDYIDRAEEKLGLSGQPRAVVFHIKEGREHCHVVWSRIDRQNEKAVPMAFDYDKLMLVTREFARDHGLELPQGYFKGKGDKARQLGLYELHQQRDTGLTLAERKEHITDAWRSSDSPKAFIQALAARGYILATGKRPYVLVDLYGHMNALPKLIDDKSVRTKDIRTFLGKDFSPENLPSIEEAKALAARHRAELESHRKHEQDALARERLLKMQAARREQIEAQQTTLRQRQHTERQTLARTQRAARDGLRDAYLAEGRRIRKARQKSRPQGLAEFLGRVSGLTLIQKKLRQYQDRRRYQAYLATRDQLRDRQETERGHQHRRHNLQALELTRKARALHHIDKRELRSLEESLRAEQRIAARGGHGHIPALNLDLKPRDQRAALRKAQDHDHSSATGEFSSAAGSPEQQQDKVDLAGDFKRAAEEGKAGGKDSAGRSDGPSPATESKLERYRRSRSRERDRDRDKDRER